MSNSNGSKQVLLSVIGIAILVIAVVGVAFAFFNYTRTGASNTIKVGKIAFNSRQNGVINLTNVFPIDPEETGIMDDLEKVGSIAINITGDTTYSDGIEYLVSAVNVNNSIGTGNKKKQIPISISISYEENENKEIGTPNSDYFDNRGGNTSLYKVLAGKTINEGDKLLVGYLASGQTGIDGNINIKAYVDKNQIAISDTYHEEYIPGYTYVINRNMSDTVINNCVSFFGSLNISLEEGESLRNFCMGNGTISGLSLQDIVDNGYFNNDLYNLNIIFSTESETTAEWVNGRTILTTDEWNSLQLSEISFKVKVEANEGIWVKNRNSMINLSSVNNLFESSDVVDNIVEISFDDMKSNIMHERYANATYKADITSNDGEVLTWLEEDLNDNTKYKMYIVSNGDTYFPINSSNMFFGFSGVKKIEFNNINTSEVINMYGLFSGCSNLINLDLTSFDTNRVTNMTNMFVNCSNLETINMSNLGGDNLSQANGMFYSCAKLREINMSGFNFGQLSEIRFCDLVSLESINLDNAITDSLTSMYTMFAGDSSLTTISMNNINTSNVRNMDFMFQKCTSLVNLNLTELSTTSVQSFNQMFTGCSNLVTLDLSSFDMSSATNINYMFFDCSALTTIYVSNSWDVSNVTSSLNTFSNCTSISGGAGTTYDENYVDKEYAIIDGGSSNPGYLTLKTN